MNLSDFIRSSREPILEEWESFSRSMPSATECMERAKDSHSSRMGSRFDRIKSDRFMLLSLYRPPDSVVASWAFSRDLKGSIPEDALPPPGLRRTREPRDVKADVKADASAIVRLTGSHAAACALMFRTKVFIVAVATTPACRDLCQRGR